MSKNAPDFSGSFELVRDQLTETEHRLRNRKRNLNQSPEPASAANIQSRDDVGDRQIDETSQSFFEAFPKKNDQTASQTSINRNREQRRNLTLKVLESNEAEFNRLFHLLQLDGDARRKQDLADEALDLLFAKYRRIIDAT